MFLPDFMAFVVKNDGYNIRLRYNRKIRAGGARIFFVMRGWAEFRRGRGGACVERGYAQPAAERTMVRRCPAEVW